MAWFLVALRYDAAAIPALRPEHRRFMAGHAARGDVAFAGRYADESGGRRVPERSLTVGVRPVAEGESCEVGTWPSG
ncbi:YciI family protein [Pseudonocardia dioxanivorans]|uniref:hypothetical protein n=1 Tax=Pseudonocardia dioxanivorans TaxID=240495 RepID=UPI000CD11CA0|nr:hypothetical protein [Pseudonocardia dioxanivorans]